MNIPTFRYLEDAIKLIKQIQDETNELSVVNKSKIKMQATTEEFQVRGPKKKFRPLTMVTPEREKIAIPGGVKNLKQQYKVLEDLNDKYQTLDAISTQIQMQFHDNRDLKKAQGELERAKGKLEKEMRDIFTFLNNIAQAHVPTAFQTYVDAVNSELSEHVAFESSQQFLYINTSDEGSLVFTNYTILHNAANEDGELATLYIAIQWDMGVGTNDSSIKVYLDHDFELPARLAKSNAGTEVNNVQQAVRALSNLLEAENFSSSLGVIPLSLQLKIKPDMLKSDLFSYRDYISKIVMDDSASTMTFQLKKGAGVDQESARKVAQQLFLELKAITKKRQGAKLRTKIYRDQGVWNIQFSIQGIAQGMELDVYDLEFLRDRFSLNDAQLRRIAQIIKG